MALPNADLIGYSPSRASPRYSRDKTTTADMPFDEFPVLGVVLSGVGAVLRTQIATGMGSPSGVRMRRSNLPLGTVSGRCGGRRRVADAVL